MFKYTFTIITLSLCILSLIACHAITTQPAITPPTVSDMTPTDYPGLHQVVAYAPGIYSGAVPEGDAGFATLKAMGIKTIISVDGAKPELDRANEQGLSYVHLPFGYDGVPHDRQLEIARAVRDLEHPIYIHCHHGKHRSAAGTATAAVALGLLTNEQAIARMKVSGTAPSYRGLYRDVEAATPVSKAQLDSASHDFPQVWQTENMVDAMVAIDAAHDHLKDIQQAGWKVPAAHPDLIPASEAGQLADLLRNLRDDEHVAREPKELADWMLDASSHATELETQLVNDSSQIQKLDALFKRVSQSCRDCHNTYRN